MGFLKFSLVYDIHKAIVVFFLGGGKGGNSVLLQLSHLWII